MSARLPVRRTLRGRSVGTPPRRPDGLLAPRTARGAPAPGRRLAVALATVALLAVVSPEAAAAQTPAVSGAPAAAAVPETQTILAPGDLVRVTVWRREELSGDLRVGADGSLRHPLYQDVRVAGLSMAAAKARLEEFLRRFEASPQIVLEPIFRVSVGGDVRQPNLYSLTPETTIAQAVALAGGPTERGRLDRVRLVRAGGERLLDLTRADSAVTQLPVQSGDQIFIGRRRDTMREVVLPLVGVVGSAASIANLFFRR